MAYTPVAAIISPNYWTIALPLKIIWWPWRHVVNPYFFPPPVHLCCVADLWWLTTQKPSPPPLPVSSIADADQQRLKANKNLWSVLWYCVCMWWWDFAYCVPPHSSPPLHVNLVNFLSFSNHWIHSQILTNWMFSRFSLLSNWLSLVLTWYQGLWDGGRVCG